MSDGKSFSVLAGTEQTAEDRLTALEQMWPIIQQKIQSYDKVLTEFNFLKNIIGSINQSIKDLCDNVESGSKSIDALFKLAYDMDHANIDDHVKIENDVNSIFRYLNEFKIKQSEISDKIDEKINQLISQINIHQEKINQKENIGTHIKYADDKFNDIINSISENENKFNKIESFISQIENLKKTDEEIRQNILNKYNEKSYQMDKLKDYIESCISKMNESIKYNNNKTLESTFASLCEFKKDLIISTDQSDQIKSLKAELSKRIDTVSLDGTNAILKSNNTAQQISIVEKKIENIFLLLKKYELTQQV